MSTKPGLKYGERGGERVHASFSIRRDVMMRLRLECERQGKVPARVVEQAIEAMLAFTENTDA